MKTVGFALTGFLLVTVAAQATTRTWPGSNGGDITSAANWDGTLPESADQLLFNTAQSASYVMDLLSAWTVSRIDFKDAGCTLQLGSGRTLTASGVIDFEGGKTYTLKSGTLESTGNRIFLGDSSEGNTLVVEGSGTTLKTPPASVENSYVALGQNKKGQTLIVRDGATLDGNLMMSVNNAESSNNRFLLTDSGTTWRMTGARNVRVSRGNDNELVISNKAAAVLEGVGLSNGENNEGALWIGDGGIRNALVVTDGARLSAKQSVVIGKWSGSCSARLANGGYIGSEAKVVIGNAGNSATPVSGSTLTVSGKGNGLYAKDGLVLGYGAVASDIERASYGNRLDVEAGAELAFGGMLNLGNRAGSYGNVVRLAGSMTVTNAANESFYIGANAPSNTFAIVAGGRLETDHTRIVLGHNATATNNALTVAVGAELVCNSWTNLVGESSARNTMCVDGGRAAFNNHHLIVGLNSSAPDNLVEVKNGGTLTFSNATLTVGESGARSRLIVSGGSRLAFTNANMVVGTGSWAKGSSASFEDSDVTSASATADGANFIKMGVDGNSGSNVLRFVRSRFAQDRAQTQFTIGQGKDESSRSVGNSVEILDNSVVDFKRIILGDYAKDTRLVLSNSILRVSGDFQPNYKDLTDSGCEVHFAGTNLYMTADTFDFWGDTKYVFHIPAEGYTMTNAQKTIVYANQSTVRSGAKAARAAGKKFIRVTAVPGVRQGGRWTLMRVISDKWNFDSRDWEAKNPDKPKIDNVITTDDIECDPGVTAYVTANTIEVRVTSNRGMVILYR